MPKCVNSDKINIRLNKIIGQLNAIQKMINEGVQCEQILIQINAAKNALHRVGFIVLEGHLNNCVRKGIENGQADETLEKFADALENFARMS